MTESPATPQALAAARFTYHQLWLRCEAEMSRNAAWIGVAQKEGREPVRSHVEGEIMFRQMCGLLDLIIRDDDLRAHVRDAAMRMAETEKQEAAANAAGEAEGEGNES